MSFFKFRRPSKAVLLTIAAIVLVLILLAGTKTALIFKAMSKRPYFPAINVTTALANKQNWQSEFELVGELVATQGVVLKIEEAGRVHLINFESGEKIPEGKILMQLDVAQETAQLQSAQAQLKLQQTNINRAKKLLPVKAISQSSFDQTQNDYLAAQAEVQRLLAIVEKKTIRAPFTSQAGIRKVNQGEFVTSGQEIVPLFTSDWLHLNFDLPEKYQQFIKVDQSIQFTVDNFPTQPFSAKITAIDPQISPDTRTLAVQALINNEQGELAAGMYAKIKVFLEQDSQQVTIPISAVSYAPYGNSVYVVEKIKSPETNLEITGVLQKFVTLGTQRGDLVAVLSGLKENEEVVTSGVFKLQPNMEVLVNNKVTPDANLNPTPEDS